MTTQRRVSELQRVMSVTHWHEHTSRLGKTVWHNKDASIYLVDTNFHQPRGRPEGHKEYYVESLTERGIRFWYFDDSEKAVDKVVEVMAKWSGTEKVRNRLETLMHHLA